MTRPDLSQRKGLSKSALIDFDMCQQRAWFSLHKPQPWIANPDASFGRAIDRGVEVLIQCARAGIPIDLQRAIAAALTQEADEVDIDGDEVELAVRAFALDEEQPAPPLLPCPKCGAELKPHFKPRNQDRPPGFRCTGCEWVTSDPDDPTCHAERQRAPLNDHDWAYCRTQAHIHVPVWDLGEVDGHPDIILASNVVFDVKAAKRKRPTARTLELFLYAVMVEVETGRHVPEVGYLVWNRAGRYWQTITTFVTEDMRGWAYERVSAYIRAVRADEVLNKDREPVNWTFPGYAVNSRFCDGCRFNPLYGAERPCRMAVSEESDE